MVSFPSQLWVIAVGDQGVIKQEFYNSSSVYMEESVFYVGCRLKMGRDVRQSSQPCSVACPLVEYVAMQLPVDLPTFLIIDNRVNILTEDGTSRRQGRSWKSLKCSRSSQKPQDKGLELSKEGVLCTYMAENVAHSALTCGESNIAVNLLIEGA